MTAEKKVAGFWRRFLAYNVDYAIIYIISFLPSVGYSLARGQHPFSQILLTTRIEQPQPFSATTILLSVIPFILIVSYEVYFWVHRDGATPGKKLLAIKIVRENNLPITYPLALGRYFARFLSYFLFGLGFLWIIWDKNKQTWHDKIVKTLVVQTDKKPKILLALLIMIVCWVAIAVYLGMILKAIEPIIKESARQNQQEMKKELSAANPHIKSAIQKLNSAYILSQKDPLTESQVKEVDQIYNEAIVEAKTATEKDPQNFLGWYYLGQAYTGMMGITKDADTLAIDAYKKAISLEPNYRLSYSGLGFVYFRLAQYQNSLEYFKKATTLDPSYSEAYHYIGLSYQQLGNTEEARKAFEKTLQLLPSTDPLREEAESKLKSL